MLNALSPLIGAESELGEKAVGMGWADGVSSKKIDNWRKKGTELVKDELECVVQEVTSLEYGRLLRKVCLYMVSDLR